MSKFNSVVAFTKKEFIECKRTHKFLIIFSVFLMFGLTNPIVAKIMPELFKNMQGVTIEFPVPTVIDAWVQYYQNIMFQLLMFVILFANTMSNEIIKGTFINLITKGLSRTSIILSKFIFISSVWTVCLGFSVVLTHFISISILDGTISNLLFAIFGTWIFGILIISVMMLGSIYFKNSYGSMLTVFVFYIFLNLIKVLPLVKKINPYRLISDSCGILNQALKPQEFIGTLIIGIVLIIIFMFVIITKFKKTNL